MTLFRDTDKGAAFIATAESRNTSPEVMRAIAVYSRNAKHAIEVWDGTDANMEYSIAFKATNYGQLNGADLHWGDRTLDQIMADWDVS